MFTRTRLLVVAVAAPLALIAATTAPASAATVTAGVAAVQGSGSINPPLTAAPAIQAFSFNGTATVVGVISGSTELAVPHSISADGVGFGNVLEGAGTLTVNVSGLPVMSGVFVRVGVVLVVAVTGPLASAGAGVCDFIPGQLPPLTVWNYTVSCAALAVE